MPRAEPSRRKPRPGWCLRPEPARWGRPGPWKLRNARPQAPTSDTLRVGPSNGVIPSAGDSEARRSLRPAAVDVRFHGTILSSELKEYCLMTVLNAPATCRSPPACLARARCCSQRSNPHSSSPGRQDSRPGPREKGASRAGVSPGVRPSPRREAASAVAV